MTDTMLTLDGITQPINDWTLDYGIYPAVITQRLERGWPVERAITTPMIVAPGQILCGYHIPGLPPLAKTKRTQSSQHHTTVQGKRIVHNGQSLTIRQWSDLLGISYSTIAGRLRLGLPVEKVLAISLRPVRAEKVTTKHLLEHDGMRLTVCGWAKHIGIANSTLYRRLKNGWSLSDALSLPNMSGKAGVVADFVASKGTGGGSTTQVST